MELIGVVVPYVY